MTIYDRDEPDDVEVIDRWTDGVGWVAHPDEDGRRASHALRGEDGVWLLDPIDAPGVDDLIDDLGAVAGVATLSDYHARDADAFAARYGVPVHVPSVLDRAPNRIDTEIERFEGSLGNSGFEALGHAPFPGWSEAFLHRPADGTLYAPDAMAAEKGTRVGDERIALYLLLRLAPPRDLLDGVDPQRVLFGHGAGVFENAGTALDHALANARRNFPRAFVTGGWTELKLAMAAFR
ncbi:hypothetical protein SAMN06269185_1457 [Natronoarchaeum philippinense]|uniref:Glyoxylase, beta-lactamase superfamily II n=1 Tax=Natronoarchaeum philippinense TaxID=558529 RepID=A0A285NR60_NATPI|nr:hypothetical protein [Natronoarchaeum philippinense]SNZ12002.1 hypothetical protein SAMN06269185_1457 [Natronoarchaeum philippinense]